ncbi:MAG TPA: CDGSH iron-sulfur domain-containing protein [Actinomycetota bacterium]|nr:CDGSH iron-sulfur domain-containing protein [Actinomycetota bacterium]
MGDVYHTLVGYGSAMRIHVVVGGPMLVEGVPAAVLRHGESGFELEPLTTSAIFAVCRCGRSSAMPLCDREAPFGCFAEESPSGPQPAPFGWDVPDPADGPALALKPNGPVRVAGAVPITHGGREVPVRDRVSLCRCGASRCQPLCDGSHKIVGFRG